MLRVIHPFHDKYSPEKIFYPGEFVIVEDAGRLKDILDRGLAVEGEPENSNAVVKTLERQEDAKEDAEESDEVAEETKSTKKSKKK